MQSPDQTNVKKPGKEQESFAPPASQAPEWASDWLRGCFFARYVRRIEAEAKTVVADAKKNRDVVNGLGAVFAVNVVETGSLNAGFGSYGTMLQRRTS